MELNTVHANDFSYFEELNQIVQEVPSEALDPERLGLFASIGIEKGKPFAPDARMKKILTAGRRQDLQDPPTAQRPGEGLLVLRRV